MHDITLTTARRQVGRSRITDHYWRCSCGEETTAPTGFRTRQEAHVNSLSHRQYERPQPRRKTPPMAHSKAKAFDNLTTALRAEIDSMAADLADVGYAYETGAATFLRGLHVTVEGRTCVVLANTRSYRYGHYAAVVMHGVLDDLGLRDSGTCWDEDNRLVYQFNPSPEQENRSPMSEAHTYLNKAAAVLASAMDEKRAWPVDLDESAPQWATLMAQLGEITRWTVQAPALVIEDAAKLPSAEGRPLAATAAKLILALNSVTTERAVVDHKWQAIATTFARARDTLPANKEQRETQVAGIVHDAADVVRKAASQRLAATDVVPALRAASAVCEAMCSLVMRISVAIEQRADDHANLAGLARSLRRSIHTPYRDAGEQFAVAAQLAEQIMTRWPGRWPNSV